MVHEIDADASSTRDVDADEGVSFSFAKGTQGDTGDRIRPFSQPPFADSVDINLKNIGAKLFSLYFFLLFYETNVEFIRTLLVRVKYSFCDFTSSSNLEEKRIDVYNILIEILLGYFLFLFYKDYNIL